METNFKVCSGYVLSSIRRHLRERGFTVEEVEATGKLQEKVERGYIRWCKEMVVPAEMLEDKKTFLDISRMGCGKTWTKRKTRQDGVEKLEKEVARKSRAAYHSKWK